MNRVALSFLFCFCITTTFGQSLTKDELKGVKEFIECIKTKNKQKLITLVSFPIIREYPIPAIKDSLELLSRYDEIFDEKLTKLIVSSNPNKDWNKMGWRGIMLKLGEVWLDEFGKLTGVTYQSKFEQNKLRELITAEKSSLHSSIKTFKKPICVLKTSKYIIRIDDMGASKYRYSCWPIQSMMSEKPDLVLLNGECEYYGSGGNHSYFFKNGAYTYECVMHVIGDEEGDGRDATLKITKGDKQILSQKADIVKK